MRIGEFAARNQVTTKMLRYYMDKQLRLLNIKHESVHEIKKNIPNMEMFLDEAKNIMDASSDQDDLAVFRLDISHFKQVNDDFGFDVGDNVIVTCFQMIEANVSANLSEAAIGRAHGDEFIVFARAGKELLESTAQGIVSDMKQFNFASIGCERQMGCYIGGIISRARSITDIRNMMEQSIELINHARKKGPNSIAIESVI